MYIDDIIIAPDHHGRITIRITSQGEKEGEVAITSDYNQLLAVSRQSADDEAVYVGTIQAEKESERGVVRAKPGAEREGLETVGGLVPRPRGGELAGWLASRRAVLSPPEQQRLQRDS